jgi:hypothetical protein
MKQKLSTLLLCICCIATLSAQTWKQRKDLPGAGIVYGASFVIGNFGYAGLGDKYATDFLKFDPKKDTWTPEQDV